MARRQASTKTAFPGDSNALVTERGEEATPVISESGSQLETKGDGIHESYKDCVATAPGKVYEQESTAKDLSLEGCVLRPTKDDGAGGILSKGKSLAELS